MTTRLAAVVVLAFVACHKEPADRASASDRSAAEHLSWYRAALQAPDGDMAFLLGLPPPGSNGPAVVQNGVDRIEHAATWDGKALRIEFPVYQTALSASLGADGALHGAFQSSSRSWGASSLPVIARPIAGPSIAALATVTDGPVLDLGAAHTVWKLAMVDEGIVRLELDQIAPGDFQGTVTFASGNITYVAGNGRGQRLALAGFDGAVPARLIVELAADRKTGSGEWLTGQKLDWRERLTVERVAELALTSNQPAPRGAVITLPELAGLDGKPILLELAGSWCSSCRNAAPVLRALYDEYRGRGLAIVTLLYEFTDDPAANREQAAIFTQTYGIPWKVVAVPGTPEDLADILPPGFEKVGVSGFPVAIFLSANHTVLAVHNGFPASGTPAYAEAAAWYRSQAKLIVENH